MGLERASDDLLHLHAHVGGSSGGPSLGSGLRVSFLPLPSAEVAEREQPGQVFESFQVWRHALSIIATPGPEEAGPSLLTTNGDKYN